MTLDEFFAGQADSRRLFEALQAAIETIGPVELRVSKSQVSFRRRVAFAWAWMPSQYLRRPAAPLVLTLSLRQPDPSPRWKSIVEPHPGRFARRSPDHSSGARGTFESPCSQQKGTYRLVQGL